MVKLISALYDRLCHCYQTSSYVRRRERCGHMPAIRRKPKCSSPSVVRQAEACTIDSFVDLSQAFMKQNLMFIPREDLSTYLWNLYKKVVKAYEPTSTLLRQSHLEFRWTMEVKYRHYGEVFLVRVPILRNVKLCTTNHAKGCITLSYYLCQDRKEREALHKLHTTSKSSSSMKEKPKETKDEYYKLR